MGGGRPRLDPKVVAEERAALQQLMADYYKLDYEENVAGINCRFKYKTVGGSRRGLAGYACRWAGLKNGRGGFAG
jgi:protein KRI1